MHTANEPQNSHCVCFYFPFHNFTSTIHFCACTFGLHQALLFHILLLCGECHFRPFACALFKAFNLPHFRNNALLSSFISIPCYLWRRHQLKIIILHSNERCGKYNFLTLSIYLVVSLMLCILWTPIFFNSIATSGKKIKIFSKIIESETKWKMKHFYFWNLKLLIFSAGMLVWLRVDYGLLNVQSDTVRYDPDVVPKKNARPEMARNVQWSSEWIDWNVST
jgi:hypothetical protein